ncbi:hypothetical protein GGR52DRAFT_65772 [Hypoxylon sp. FL1284]|nr:hypothetical protein GGR52DRAFT_65772 [Hypoxylon sp. FL1284]
MIVIIVAGIIGILTMICFGLSYKSDTVVDLPEKRAIFEVASGSELTTTTAVASSGVLGFIAMAMMGATTSSSGQIPAATMNSVVAVRGRDDAEAPLSVYKEFSTTTNGIEEIVTTIFITVTPGSESHKHPSATSGVSNASETTTKTPTSDTETLDTTVPNSTSIAHLTSTLTSAAVTTMSSVTYTHTSTTSSTNTESDFCPFPSHPHVWTPCASGNHPPTSTTSYAVVTETPTSAAPWLRNPFSRLRRALVNLWNLETGQAQRQQLQAPQQQRGSRIVLRRQIEGYGDMSNTGNDHADINAGGDDDAFDGDSNGKTHHDRSTGSDDELDNCECRRERKALTAALTVAHVQRIMISEYERVAASLERDLTDAMRNVPNMSTTPFDAGNDQDHGHGRSNNNNDRASEVRSENRSESGSR